MPKPQRVGGDQDGTRRSVWLAWISHQGEGDDG